MAAHRYWRLNITAINGGSSGASIAEMKFFDSAGTQISTAGGTPTASSSLDANRQPAKAFDGSTGGFTWISNGTSMPQWLKMDFGSGNDKDVAFVDIHPESGQSGRAPRFFQVQWSDDDTNWTDLYSTTTGEATNGIQQWIFAYYRFPCRLKESWRIRMDDVYLASRTNAAIAELEFSLTAAGADVIPTTAPYYSPTTYAAGNPASAIDNNNTTFWATTPKPTVGSPQYITYQLGATQAIVEMRIRARNDTFHDQFPTKGEVAYSDGVGGWVVTGTYDFSGDGSSAGQVHTMAISSAPDLISISPPAGPVTGGTAVTLTGSNFTGTTDVKFDGVSATSIVVVNSTTITCVTPAGSVGPADVEIFNPGGNDTLAAGFDYEANEARITQIPILVLDLSPQEVHVTQIPILVLYTEQQPNRITQIPINVVYSPKPVPLPGPVIPEVPVLETWSWKTALSGAINSQEQRSRLREVPRYGQSFSVLILDEEDRVRIYNLLMRYLRTTFLYPMFQYNVKLDQDAAVSATKLFCNTSRTDVRAGEFVTLYDPHLETITYLEITTVDADGVNLVDPLTVAIPKYYQLCPSFKFRIASGASISMTNLSGDLTITMESVEPRVFQRPTAAPTLTTIDGILIVPDRDLAEDGIPETFINGAEWFDNETSVPEIFNEWRQPHVGSSRRYKYDRWTQSDYWRAVCDNSKGKQGVALFPTFRDDLPLRDAMVLNSVSFTTANINFFLWYLETNYRYIAISTANGMKYRRVNGVEPHYDLNGDPDYLTVVMASSTGNTAGDNVIASISYMNLCRFDNDTVRLTHSEHHSIIEFPIMAVNK